MRRICKLAFDIRLGMKTGKGDFSQHYVGENRVVFDAIAPKTQLISKNKLIRSEISFRLFLS